MRISLETKPSTTIPAPEHQYGGEGNYRQRDQLLPIHAGKITLKSCRATRYLRNKFIFYCLSQGKNRQLASKSPLSVRFNP
jgi:hypothetical protein